MELEIGAEFTSDGQRYTINAVDHVPAHGEYADCFTVYAEAVALIADEPCDCGSCGECLGTMNPYVEVFYKQLEDTLTDNRLNE